ncbi:hypothetical protein K469DRAFT_802581 [Zopfia rhizophila CBS 207.26]|uniref:Uncharacterized protein n=1 Tax=Zopfia rhizophila CBS 207.26 TaxID=1314779 RepID=A0A6A6DIH2_9PEZI|nr:hypothetical protein K469DRAFT_802581 [Zopfia rhizophila CBS 207.26]
MAQKWVSGRPSLARCKSSINDPQTQNLDVLIQEPPKHWIQRLRFQIPVDEKKRKSTQHLIYDGHPKDAVCPSRKPIPIDCPCETKSWTRNYEIPLGCFIMLALPYTIREWVKAVKDLFEDAQLLDDPEFSDFRPFQVVIEYVDTTNELRRTARERSDHKTRKGEVLPNHLTPLTGEEMESANENIKFGDGPAPDFNPVLHVFDEVLMVVISDNGETQRRRMRGGQGKPGEERRATAGRRADEKRGSG